MGWWEEGMREQLGVGGSVRQPRCRGAPRLCFMQPALLRRCGCCITERTRAGRVCALAAASVPSGCGGGGGGGAGKAREVACVCMTADAAHVGKGCFWGGVVIFRTEKWRIYGR